MTPEAPAPAAAQADETTATATAEAPPAEETLDAAQQPSEASGGSPVAVQPVAFTQLEGGAADAEQAAPRPLDLILDIQVPVTIELGHTVLPIEDLLALRPGSILELDKLASEPIDLLIRDHVIAHGEIIVIDDTLGLRITHILDPADRVKPLGTPEPADDEPAASDEQAAEADS